MTERFKTGQSEPQIPKDALPTTGKEMWYLAPILPVMTMKAPAIEYPIQTQIHDCHQARPGFMMLADEIIHVLMLKESAIQKATCVLSAKRFCEGRFGVTALYHSLAIGIRHCRRWTTGTYTYCEDISTIHLSAYRI